MALTEEQYAEIRKELDECQNPLFFFDDDQDGLCSFLQLYKYKKEGKGIIVKTSPRLDENFARKVEEYGPDKVFVLDIAVIEDSFIENVNVPIIWIDHHGPFKKQGVKYFNPKVENIEHNLPTSYLCYRAVQQDLWLAATGCVADWFIPEFIEEFKSQYPDMIERDFEGPGDILFGGTRLGQFIRMLSFILKGKTSDVMKSVKVMTRIDDPYEILDQTTDQGKFIYKRFMSFNEQYDRMLTNAMKKAEEDKEGMIVYTYKDDETSFTSDLSNELTYNYPNNMLFVCREKDGDMKCSMRSTQHNLPEILEKTLVGLQGTGGGHKNACGLNIIKEQFDEFLERVQKETNS